MAEPIQIYVSVKHMANITKTVKQYPFMLKNKPNTMRELVSECVVCCTEAYSLRNSNSKTPSPLTALQFEEMKELGKFAFGVHYNENDVNIDKTVKIAIEAVSDGIVRIFKGQDELMGLDNKIEVNEGDVFTFVRLTMLSGRMW